MKCPRCGGQLTALPSGAVYCFEHQGGWLKHELEELMAQVPPVPRDPLLQEREKTHGSFALNADISQKLKAVLSFNRFLRKSVHNEVLDMIALKLSRICSGQENFKDHWDDIAGYAKLGAEACE